MINLFQVKISTVTMKLVDSLGNNLSIAFKIVI